MRKLARSASVVVAMVGLAGCYTATVNTGRPASGQVVQKDWAHSFLYGLVPPATVETITQCPNGVASVTTQLSFLNQVAAALTGGIYTPMSIRATCAAAGVTMTTPDPARTIAAVPGASAEQLAEAFNEAVLMAREDGKPAYVTFGSAAE